jgi:hypothetical protein
MSYDKPIPERPTFTTPPEKCSEKACHGWGWPCPHCKRIRCPGHFGLHHLAISLRPLEFKYFWMCMPRCK